MIRINNIIQNACQRVGIVGDGQPVNENYSMAALSDLKAVIIDLNTQNYILENYQVVDFRCGKEIRFAKLPDGWVEYQTTDAMIADIDNRKIDDVAKVGNEFYFLAFGHGGITWQTSYEFEQKMSKLWPGCVITGNLPDRVFGMGRKLNSKYVKIYPGDKTKIDQFQPYGLSSMYCVDTEHEKIVVGSTTYYIEYFHVEFNTTMVLDYRMTYLESIDDLDIDDVLYYSSKYQNLIEDGLCVKLCMRYHYLDALPMYQEEFETDKGNIKVINDANRPEVYENFSTNGYNFSYERGLAGDW